jgi:hypothetical protein
LYRAGHTTCHIIVRRICVVCWITKAANTHSESVILLVCARKQWLLECASMLRFACIVVKTFSVSYVMNTDQLVAKSSVSSLGDQERKEGRKNDRQNHVWPITQNILYKFI